MNINWKQKLSSRKFWAAVVTFVTTVLVAFGVPDITVEQVAAVITAGAAMIAYIIGEGLVDAASAGAGAEARLQNGNSGIHGNSTIAGAPPEPGGNDDGEEPCNEECDKGVSVKK